MKKQITLSGICLLVALCFASVSLSGCADLRNKFIRKKKEKPQAKRYYAVKTYHVKPSIELYTKRYVLWRSWQSELEAVLTNSNFKKPRMAAEQALSNLTDMRNMLVDEKADQLQRYVDDMTYVEKTIKNQRVTSGNQAQLQKRVEVVGFEVERRFSYNDMRKYIRSEFRSAEEKMAREEAAKAEIAKDDAAEAAAAGAPASEAEPAGAAVSPVSTTSAQAAESNPE